MSERERELDTFAYGVKEGSEDRVRERERVEERKKAKKRQIEK